MLFLRNYSFGKFSVVCDKNHKQMILERNISEKNLVLFRVDSKNVFKKKKTAEITENISQMGPKEIFEI